MTDTESQQQEAAAAPDAGHQGAGPGDLLRKARESRGMTPTDVARALCLETHLVEAIDDDRYEAFGAGVFARGHVRRYAAQVGVSVDEVLAVWDARYAAPSQPATPDPKPADVVRPSGGSSFVAVGLGLAALVALVIFAWWWLRPPEAAGPAELLDEWMDTDSAAQGADDAPLLPPPADNDYATYQPAGNGDAAAAGGTPGAYRSVNVPDTTTSAPAQRGADGGAATVAASEVASAFAAPGASGTAMALPATDAPVPALRSDEPADSQRVDESAVQTPDAPEVTLAAAGEAPAGTGEEIAVRFIFEESCWVNVRDATGQQIMFGLREAGVVNDRTGVPPISVTLGRYPGVLIEVDGQPFEVPDSAINGAVARFEIPSP